jgi:non-homologous end joining protein Ku
VAPRAYWKGYLKVSLVSCPVALFPASSEREKISFNQINKNTGNRIRYRKVDAETGDEVDSADIIEGYEVVDGEVADRHSLLFVRRSARKAWWRSGKELR